MPQEFYQFFVDNVRKKFEVRGPMTDEKALERKSELERQGRKIDRIPMKADVAIQEIASNFATGSGLTQVDDLSA